MGMWDRTCVYIYIHVSGYIGIYLKKNANTIIKSKYIQRMYIYIYMYVSSRQNPLHVTSCYCYCYRFSGDPMAFQGFVDISIFEIQHEAKSQS